jgi:hypothetical protein
MLYARGRQVHKKLSLENLVEINHVEDHRKHNIKMVVKIVCDGMDWTDGGHDWVW